MLRRQARRATTSGWPKRRTPISASKSATRAATARVPVPDNAIYHLAGALYRLVQLSLSRCS